MNLFKQVVSDDLLHQNFKMIMKKNNEDKVAIGIDMPKDRQKLESWCNGFPDRDKKFVKEFQISFNSCFWEIYLYKLFGDYGFNFNWDHASPDFFLNANGIDFIVEATTANKANDERPNEWEKEEVLANPLNPDALEHYQNNMNEANRYSMIRLSNGIFSKHSYYKKKYEKLSHVKNKPFVIAIAPFEQPFFYFQYSRPIMALLYDVYIDEEISIKNPKEYPTPLTCYLNSIEKDNGAEINLGIFNNSEMEEISAVIFNANAIWSKLRNKNRILNFLTNEGIIQEQTDELVEDGLFIFHNPYAKYPLDKSIFKKDRVCQVYVNNYNEQIDELKQWQYLENGKKLVIEFNDKHMISRVPFSF